MSLKYKLPHLPMLGKGSLLIDIYDANGGLTGYQHMGNVHKVEQEIKDDKAELYQSINKTPTLIATAVKKRQVILSIEGTDFSFTHLAIQQMASGGAETTLVTGSTPVVAEALASATATKKGKYFSTAGRNISAVAVKQGVTTLVLNTDYTIEDALQGLIYFLPSGAVNDAAAVTVDYTPVNINISQVAGAVAPFLRARLRFVPDATDGKEIGVEWWQVNLSPNGKLGLIADDYGNWQLDGMVLDDTANHPNAPYYLMTDYGATSGETGDVS
jgi:hypothetical protein